MEFRNPCPRQVAPVAISLIPTNKHPLRMGVDQHDQNRLRGEFGRLRIVNAVLTATQVRELASQGAGAAAQELAPTGALES